MITLRIGSGWHRAARIALLVALPGCGGSYEATVSGLVTLDGRPVPRGTVVYHPTANGPTAYARINEDGSYNARTGREDGLPPGEYRVGVMANEAATQQQTGDAPPPLGKAIVPTWYRSKETSGLAFQVQPGHNSIDLELSSKRPPTARGPR